MSPPQHSLRKLLPGFVIAAGTQVVLEVAKALPDGEQFKPPGSVGVVLESPADNQHPYLVRFADGETVQAYFDELALRRREVEDELGETTEDLSPWIIYRCQVGSKAFGLACEESDDDLRGIYLPPARLHWSLRRLPEQLEFKAEETDEVYWELEKFLRLALKANPNVLETLWTPLVLLADETAQELRAMRKAFLSKHVYKTYSGYVLSQFRRMANACKEKGAYKPKHAMHLIRLLYSGIAALQTGEIRIDVAEHRDELLHIRAGGLKFEEVKERALELDQQFQQAFERTALPEQPDYAQVDAFLIRARRRMVDA
ncbi:MAG: nucleotidyltransferase domain-containing protein [Thermoguttaceae bacterium]|jgi:predicted nucleotidyltransferase|nr:nucleotidyltransferase domain-containing protein [Thermoguttaceae bacterium]